MMYYIELEAVLVTPSEYTLYCSIMNYNFTYIADKLAEIRKQICLQLLDQSKLHLSDYAE